MRLTERSYPRPVVGNRDDASSEFAAKLKGRVDGQFFYLSGTIHCSSQPISDMVRSKQAAYVIHLECSATAYRSAHQQTNSDIRIEIPSRHFCGRVEVNVLACATNPGKYSLPEAHPDYAGTDFPILPGDILAVSPGVEYYVDLQSDIDKIGSIMLIRDSGEDEVPMRVDLGGEKICILLSIQDYDRYRQIKDHPLGHALSSSIVLPALTYAIDQLRSTPGDFESQRWAELLLRRLEQSGMPDESLAAAQEILKFPISRALAAGVSVLEIAEE